MTKKAEKDNSFKTMWKIFMYQDSQTGKDLLVGILLLIVGLPFMCAISGTKSMMVNAGLGLIGAVILILAVIMLSRAHYDSIDRGAEHYRWDDPDVKDYEPGE